MIPPIKGGKSLADRLKDDEQPSSTPSTEQDKISKSDNSDNTKKVEPTKKTKETNISKIVSTKLDAMQTFNLKPETNSVNAPLEDEDDFYFTMIAKKLKISKKDLSVKYVVECTKRDIVKYGLPASKEYLEK